MRRGKRLEILLCVLGLVVVSAIVFPVFAQVKIVDKAMPRGLSNVGFCSTALFMYAVDYDDLLPYVRSQKTLVSLTRCYVNKDELWQTENPLHPGVFKLNPALLGVAMGDIQNPELTPLLYDPFSQKPPFGYVGESPIFTLSYADGRARVISEKVWVGAQPFLYLDLKRHGLPLDR